MEIGMFIQNLTVELQTYMISDIGRYTFLERGERN
jgi:hypothetical protein